MDRFQVKLEADEQSANALYSSELFSGCVLKTEQIEEFSKEVSKLYLILIDDISQNIINYAQFSDLDVQALKVLTRRALVPITHFFWERLIRFYFTIRFQEKLTVVKYNFDVSPTSVIEDFEKKSNDFRYNNSIVWYLSKIWNIPISEIYEAKDIPLKKSYLQREYVNQLFQIGRLKKNLNRILQKFELFFNWLPLRNKIPVLTFANAEPALRFRGFYIDTFSRLPNNWNIQHIDLNETLRRVIFNLDIKKYSTFINYLVKLGISEKITHSSWFSFQTFLSREYPVQYLEGLKTNFEIGKGLLSRYKRKILISSGDGDTFSTFLIAVAKSLQFKIIKAQHGGHYGYLYDVSPVLEVEFPSTDIFLTWGWTRMHEGAQLEHVECVPLPSPWLSERKKYWKKLRFDIPKEYDILWMPQMMKRFTGAPQGASSIRRDVIQEFSNSMIDLANEIRNRNLKTFVKPYNFLTVALLEKTYQKIREVGGGNVTISDTYDKGLALELIQNCTLVLWDQPGTGFLECLSCGIPTLVYWDRLYCEEEEWTKADFEILEKNGIIHRSVSSLFEEAVFLLQNPLSWMQEPSRQIAIDSFCRKYALTSENWSGDWKYYLKSLKKVI
ncbi:transferase [Leptospira noguchii]|uniref:Transferase n=1 Tax=Leptospira noguchii TaxID=28182 RepID=A0AAE9K7Z8_9LEPT|nr:transferase [Leptospira noguchii]UOG55411.1 transferase [Leptospira noguchii]